MVVAMVMNIAGGGAYRNPLEAWRVPGVMQIAAKGSYRMSGFSQGPADWDFTCHRLHWGWGVK
jgi:hypothetical protein